MRVLIVDDEPAARARLRLMLEELDIEFAGEAADGVEALRLAGELDPDVLLLDIQMREVSGLDVARHLQRPRPVVIFQTAHDHYAVAAFEEAALDYLLKPVSLARLRIALDRASQRLAGSNAGGIDMAILSRIESALASRRPPAPGRILVRDPSGHRLLSAREILRFSAVDGSVQAYTIHGSFPADFTLDELEKRFAGSFVRVSRSDLVNIDAVRHVRGDGDGAALLTLADSSTVRVSRRRAPDVRRLLGM